MNDIHRQYIDDGEIIYRVKPTDLKCLPGRNRAQINWKLINPTLVTHCNIYHKDSLIKTVSIAETNNDTIYVNTIIDNLDEGQFDFEVYSLDVLGNRSIKSDIFVTTYGSKYEKQLKPKRIESINIFDDFIEVKWYSTDTSLFTEIYYKDKNNTDKTIKIKPEETVTKIFDFVLDNEFYTRTYYKPSENAIDSFWVDSETMYIK